MRFTVQYEDGELILAQPSSIKAVYTAGEDIGGHKVVYLGGDSKVYLADKSNTAIAGKIIGLSNQSAVEGDHIEVITQGAIKNSGWGLTAGALYYLGSDGAITATPPTSGLSQLLGAAPYSNTLEIKLFIPIILG